ncbi:hypothetical protein BDW22DRAFT_1355868 [Trametopsis cervina]|nr:hypothetical protein BDW22DRAFT_1355868 [Trametopsis cervina]
MICVIGSQSAGKSSLIESISGITLPRASGTCTRCPTECRLSSSNEEWECVVSLRFTTDMQGKPLGQPRNEPFGNIIVDKSEVEERLRRAQRAILNPRTPSSKFLTDKFVVDEDNEIMFSRNCISLQISGRNVADLSFVDLPGMIASGPDKEIIEALVVSYITRPSCIMLLTVPCETDYENSKGFDLIQQFDPNGTRTIGVLTKPDRIGRGDQDTWVKFMKNEVKPLENGWFSVKQPDTQAIQEGITWEEAREQEEVFFLKTSPWADLNGELKLQLGTANLTERLSVILSALIAKRLPELQEELQNLISQTEEALGRLPKPPPGNPVNEILRLIAHFVDDVSSHLEGTPGKEGLLQQIRPAQAEFRRAIHATAPNFRAITRETEAEDEATADCENAIASRSFLAYEEEASTIADYTHDPIYIDEVMEAAEDARTRELRDHYPFDVTKEYIKSCVDKWNTPSRKLFDTTVQILNAHIKLIIAHHFGKFTYGSLQQRVTTIINEHLKTCGDDTVRQLTWLLDLEMRPRTMNDHYYADCRDRFLVLYRASRQQQHGSFTATLAQWTAGVPAPPNVDNAFSNNVGSILARLAQIGFSGTQGIDLLKLLPSDPMDPALTIMAAARAYFQVAYKRFVDNVPNAIDHELILGMNRDRRLEDVLHDGLGVTESDAKQRCAEYLSDPPHITSRRNELQRRRERLESAKKELMNI